MSEDEPQPERTPRVSRRRAALGYDARSERRTLRGQARRRKTRTKFWLVAAPAVVVVAAVAALLVLFGGASDEIGGEETSTTIAGPVVRNDLLMIEADDSVPMVVLLQTRDKGGLVLVIPGSTLLKSGDEFMTLDGVYASGKKEALGAALEEAFETEVEAVASVPWSSLRDAMVSAAFTDVPALALTSSEEEADRIAELVLALIRGGGLGTGVSAWQTLGLTGDSLGFLDAVGVAAAIPAGGQWIATALTGTVVEGSDYEYLLPLTARVKALLGGATEESTTTVRIQNGSGAVGVNERAAAQLVSLGYTVVPAGNSDDFPGVEVTRIKASKETAAVGERVLSTLGAGTFTEDETVERDLVIVVLGKDYAPSASTGGD